MPGRTQQAVDERTRGAVVITGVMTEHARFLFTAGLPRHALMFIELDTATGWPYVGQIDCGTEPTPINAAEAKARLLKRGTCVTVYARGITGRTDHGRAVLALVGITDVIPEIPHPTEPRPPVGPQE